MDDTLLLLPKLRKKMKMMEIKNTIKYFFKKKKIGLIEICE